MEKGRRRRTEGDVEETERDGERKDMENGRRWRKGEDGVGKENKKESRCRREGDGEQKEMENGRRWRRKGDGESKEME